MYHDAHQAEPYLPPFDTPALRGVATQACYEAERLMAKVPPARHDELTNGTRQVNATTSNALENETRDEYLHAHEQAELSLDNTGSVGAQALGSDVLRRVHRELYTSVARVETGDWRTQNVKVQGHVAPKWESVPLFLSRTDEVYLQPWKSSAERKRAVIPPLRLMA